MSISRGTGSSDPTDQLSSPTGQLSSERFHSETALSARSTDAEEEGKGVQLSFDGGAPAAGAAGVTRLQEEGLCLTGVGSEGLRFFVGVVGMTCWMLSSVTSVSSVTGDGGADKEAAVSGWSAREVSC